MSDSLDVKGMIVDASYDGPRLEEDCIVTKDFVQAMVLHFKQCQTIHSRYAFEILLQTKCILEELPSVIDVDVPEVRRDLC